MAGLHLIRNENNFEKGSGGGGLQSNPAVYFGKFWRFSGQRARFRERVPTILQLVVALNEEALLVWLIPFPKGLRTIHSPVRIHNNSPNFLRNYTRAQCMAVF